MNEYEINSLTLMLEYKDINLTTVYEINNKFEVNQNIKDIVETSCCFYGSTYEGRLSCSKSILNTNIKVPVVVEDIKKIIFFPTKARFYKDCRWISFNNLRSINKIPRMSGYTRLTFNNNVDIDIDNSYDIIKRQYYNCMLLEKTLISRQGNA